MLDNNKLNLTTGDWVDILLLIVALFTGGINYFYTKKKFEATYYPLLAISVLLSKNTIGRRVKAYENYETRLSVRIKNPTENIPVQDVEVYLMIRRPINKWQIWKKKWIIYEVIELPYIEAFGVEEIYVEDSIEKFLSDKFPIVIDKIRPKGLDETAEYYTLNSSMDLELKVEARYKPHIKNARFIEVEKVFDIISSGQDIGLDYPMIDWKLNPSQSKLPLIG